MNELSCSCPETGRPPARGRNSCPGAAPSNCAASEAREGHPGTQWSPRIRGRRGFSGRLRAEGTHSSPLGFDPKGKLRRCAHCSQGSPNSTNEHICGQARQDDRGVDLGCLGRSPVLGGASSHSLSIQRETRLSSMHCQLAPAATNGVGAAHSMRCNMRCSMRCSIHCTRAPEENIAIARSSNGRHIVAI